MRGLLIALVLVAGCVKQVAVPAPTPGGYASVSPPPVSVSTMAIKAHADVAPLLAMIKMAAPRPLAKGTRVISVVDRFIAKVDADVDYWAELADATIAFDGDNVTATAVIDFKLKLRAKLSGIAGRLNLSRGLTSCGYNEPMPRIKFTITGKLHTLPGPKLHFERTGLQTTWQRPCKLTFNIRLERILNLPIIRGRVNAAIDQALEKTPTKMAVAARVKSIWDQLDRPHALGHKTWLVPHPIELAVAPITGHGTVLSTTLLVRARPQLAFGPRPSMTLTPMPAATVASPPSLTHVAVDAQLSYAAAALQLSATYKKHGPADLDITRVATYASSGQLVIALTVAKPVRTTLYLVGKPSYVPGVVELADLQFTKPSRTALLKVVSADRVHRIASELKRHSKIRLSTAATISRTLHDHQLKISSDALMQLRLRHVHAAHVWLTAQGLVTSAVLSNVRR